MSDARVRENKTDVNELTQIHTLPLASLIRVTHTRHPSRVLMHTRRDTHISDRKS